MQKTTFRHRLFRYSGLERFFRDPITHKPRPHSLKRIFNLILVFLSRMLKFSYVFGYPYNIIIEPTNVCTLNCPMCPSGNRMMKRRRGMMRFDDFKRIIDEMGDYLYQVGLMNYGESLLNPELYDMIRYAKRKNITTILSTNALFLNEENSLKVLKSGLDFLSISLDGASQDTYVKYRIKGDFPKVVENIDYLVKKKNNLKSSLFVDIGFLVTRFNQKEIEKAKDLAVKLGVDNFSLVKFAFPDYKTVSKEKVLEFLPEDPFLSRYKIVDGKLELQKKSREKTPCIWVWDRAVINWDGSLCPCCVDYDCRYYLGNYFDQGLKKIWNSKKYRDLRKKILKDRDKIEICYNCSASMD
ncbi:MAG: hypothetical protein AMJ90_05295 [candidate division Zixibacteria bacterium SM23_73_2]|nr:MAG: hypothetical protein AMJ90_05295 [candidate division Zixibacteria bacterium SM23_73_2]